MSTFTSVFVSLLQMCIAILFLLEKLHDQREGTDGGANGDAVSTEGQAKVVASATVSFLSIGKGLLSYDRLLNQKADKVFKARPKAFRAFKTGEHIQRKAWHTVLTMCHRTVELMMVVCIFFIGLGIAAKTGGGSIFLKLGVAFVFICYYGLVAVLLVKRCTNRSAIGHRGTLFM